MSKNLLMFPAKSSHVYVDLSDVKLCSLKDLREIVSTIEMFEEPVTRTSVAKNCSCHGIAPDCIVCFPKEN